MIEDFSTLQSALLLCESLSLLIEHPVYPYSYIKNCFYEENKDVWELYNKINNFTLATAILSYNNNITKTQDWD